MCCLNKVVFPVTVVRILHYIQHAFSFRVQPVRTMTITTIELLSRMFHHVMLPICFERFDSSLAIGYLVSTNMPVSSESMKMKNLILAMYVTLCPAELSNF